MPKKLDGSSRALQEGKMISVRVDARIRYLAELAAVAKGMSMTQYLEWSLTESFKLVTLRMPPPVEPFVDEDGRWTIPEAADADQERIRDEEMTVANKADLLWSESEYVRMMMRSMIAPTTMPQDQLAFVEYIANRKDLQIKVGRGYKLDREKIEANYDALCLAHHQHLRKEGK